MQVSTLVIFATSMVVSLTTAAPQGTFFNQLGFNQQRVQPLQVQPPIPIIDKTEIHDDAGQFALSYKTGDGQGFAEQGALKKSLEPEGGYVLVKQGSYSYTAPDGRPILVTYTADENGFRPTGAHIPTPPEVK